MGRRRSYTDWESTDVLNWAWMCADSEERSDAAIKNGTTLALCEENNRFSNECSSIHRLFSPWVSAKVAVRTATEFFERKFDYVFNSLGGSRIWVWENQAKTWRFLISTRGVSIEVATRLTWDEGCRAVESMYREMGVRKLPPPIFY